MKQPQLLNILVVLFMFIALIGFADAVFLTAEHYTGRIPPCSLSILNGCGTVTTSKYATVAGIPISLAGTLYYFSLFLAGLWYLDSKKEWVLRYASLFTCTGFLVSATLVALQIFVIRALCLYCIISASSSTVLFILGVIILRNIKLSAALVESAHNNPT